MTNSEVRAFNSKAEFEKWNWLAPPSPDKLDR